MKKILFIISGFIVVVTLFSLNVNLNTGSAKSKMTLNEKVKAEYYWEMKTVHCPPPSIGTYKRCENVNYSSECNVHDQTLCEQPE